MATTDSISNTISDLKKKSISIPVWGDLEKEYDPRKHPVMTDKFYRDKVKKGVPERMTRITYGWQKLATKRMAELAFGIPVKRIYKPKDEAEKKAGQILEDIYQRNRINSVNIERAKMFYACCEFITLWYAQAQPTEYAGEATPIKLRCKTFAPMKGDTLYPRFDEYDDLVALSVEYQRVEDNKTITYFDSYTDTTHNRWRNDGSGWATDIEERINIGKIAGVYAYRPEPIWENQSENVYEAEWAMSRNGNYLRKNSRPTWVICTDDNVNVGKEPTDNTAARNIVKYSKGSTAGYATWTQAIESLRFHIDEIKKNFFMQLQLPDMSMENMKATPMSGEARKMMFIDSQLKVMDEQGVWLETFDREFNVLRAFARVMYPNLAEAITSLKVEHEITPYTIQDTTERIKNLSDAAGGKAIASRRTAVSRLGWADDVDDELEAISNDEMGDVFNEPAV